ncbi:SusD/RagB family nutrient-binding outer membrane lipoprotein [Epilithonimonas sp.]|uniref:SusD/RagB family nutrient-binding outer membrane lipoprotein n=1 Tax=Epilithonimonas sp. TaxID=2894511 RepID=UPI0028966765|nr:SusD/RagB family nutrient-binding outer membrane lipoprotein [Epilithonimonas sp.]
MKKILASLTAVFLLQACNGDYTELNKDPNSYYTTVPSTLLTYAEKQLVDYLTTPSVNTNNLRLTMQYWNETSYSDESNYNFVTRNVANNVFLYLYVRSNKNIIQAKQLVNDYSPTAAEVPTWETVKKNQLAILDMLQIYTYQTAVDTFGDVPFSQAGDVDKYPLPKYDNAKDIYSQLITNLKADLASIDTSGKSFSTGEKFYNGDMTKWKKFGNSLLLKLGIALADSDPDLAKATCQAAISGGVFASSADDCNLAYLSASPNFNQMYANLVANGRNDFVAGKPIVDLMNSTNDPRRSTYFRLKNGSYIGGTIGVMTSFDNFSAPGDFAYTATTPGILMNYTEVAFYLAEASARWAIGGNAATLYNNAVTASFLQWGKTSAEASTYLLANPYDSTNWQKSIGTQAWVAMYNQPMQSWNFWRRLDYPILTPAVQAVPESNGKVPVRLQYPVSEQTTNPTNYAAGSAAIGGDYLYTKIFWDKK